MTNRTDFRSRGVCIIGATPPRPGSYGGLGWGVALRWGGVVPVVIGSRQADRAEAAAERASSLIPGGTFLGLSNRDAVRETPLVVLTVPYDAQAETLTALSADLRRDQLVVVATVPMPAGEWGPSAAEQAQTLLESSGVRVVSAFHTVAAALLGDPSVELDEDVLICGDRSGDKERVAALVNLIPGLRGIDCGPLVNARITERLTPQVLFAINRRYGGPAGIRITGVSDQALRRVGKPSLA
jgi:NADPH-dependent F420 reductase